MRTKSLTVSAVLMMTVAWAIPLLAQEPKESRSLPATAQVQPSAEGEGGPLDPVDSRVFREKRGYKQVAREKEDEQNRKHAALSGYEDSGGHH